MLPALRSLATPMLWMLFCVAIAAAEPKSDEPKADVPKGEVTKYTFDRSKIFPGTTRDYWIYVPKQYDPAKPVCVHVNQDGIGYNAPAVFDQLIAEKTMPVTIGVFIRPGEVKPLSDKALPRVNRSFEYDSVTDDYVRFLLEELLPDVEKQKTADGRPIRLSHDGNDRCIAGNSSGGICAFTAAWERPDAFTRVFSGVGSFTDLRGGNIYPSLIRKVEPKPIRVFLQDGSHDLNNFAGNWFLSGQQMESALSFAGYEVNHFWGEEKHNSIDATKVFPDAMRWLWKGWPAPVKGGKGSKELQEILIPGEDWKVAYDAKSQTEFIGSLAADAKGTIFFAHGGKIHKLNSASTASVFVADALDAQALAFGPEGKLYVSFFGRLADTRVQSFDRNAIANVIATELGAGDMIVDYRGRIWTFDWRNNTVCRIDPKEKPQSVSGPTSNMDSIAISPDQSDIYVGEMFSHVVVRNRIQPDGALAHGQQYIRAEPSEKPIDSMICKMKFDRDSRLYLATVREIQVADLEGRISCIIAGPDHKSDGALTGFTFGGEKFDVLFVAIGDKIFSRKVKTHGANAFEEPILSKKMSLDGKPKAN